MKKCSQSVSVTGGNMRKILKTIKWKLALALKHQIKRLNVRFEVSTAVIAEERRLLGNSAV